MIDIFTLLLHHLHNRKTYSLVCLDMPLRNYSLTQLVSPVAGANGPRRRVADIGML